MPLRRPLPPLLSPRRISPLRIPVRVPRRLDALVLPGARTVQPGAPHHGDGASKEASEHVAWERAARARGARRHVEPGTGEAADGAEAADWPLVFAWADPPHLAAHGRLYADLLREARLADEADEAAGGAAATGAAVDGASGDGASARVEIEACAGAAARSRSVAAPRPGPDGRPLDALPAALRAAPHLAHRHLAYVGSRVEARTVETGTVEACAGAVVTYAHRFSPRPGGCLPAPRTVLTVHTEGVDDVGGLCLPAPARRR